MGCGGILFYAYKLIIRKPQNGFGNHLGPYSRSPQVGNQIASILKSIAQRILAPIVLNPASNFFGVCYILSLLQGSVRV